MASGAPPTTPTDPPGQGAALPPDALLQALRRLLRPLVRLMMACGITFPVLVDALRRLFVDVAVNDLLTDSRARTDSRINLLTGVHRKEIKRLRSLPPDQAGPPPVVTLASLIVARWIGTPAYVGPDGQPLVLPRAVQAGGGPSFEELAQRVTSDVRPRAVLEDLIGHGAVSLEPDDMVRLNTRAFIPRPGGEEQLFYFARNLHDHVAAATANISAERPAFLDRSVHYDGLTKDQAEALRAFAREAAMRTLLDVNRRALEMLEEEAGDGADTERRRVNLGIYLFEDKDDAESRS